MSRRSKRKAAERAAREWDREYEKWWMEQFAQGYSLGPSIPKEQQIAEVNAIAVEIFGGRYYCIGDDVEFTLSS